MTKRDLVLFFSAALLGMSVTTAVLVWFLFKDRPGGDPPAQPPPHRLPQPEIVTAPTSTAETPPESVPGSVAHSDNAKAAPAVVPEVAPPSDAAFAEMPIVDLTRQGQLVKLAGALIEFSVAANGRILVLRLQDTPALQIYDVASHKVIGEIPVDDDPVCFAAGRDKVVLGLWGHSAIQRWDLATLKMDAERLVVGDEAPIGLAMGANSDGPVLSVSGAGSSQLLDLQTLEAIEIEIEGRARTWKHYPTSQHRVSANGRVFCAWDFQTLVAGVNVLRVEDRLATYLTYDDSVGHICPNSEGTHLLTAIGRYRLDQRPNQLGQPPGFLIPAVSGPFFIRIQLAASSQPPRIALFTADQTKPLARISGLNFTHVVDIGVRRAFDTKLVSPFPPDRRMIVIPVVNEIVTVGPNLRSLQHWPFDFARWE